MQVIVLLSHSLLPLTLILYSSYKHDRLYDLVQKKKIERELTILCERALTFGDHPRIIYTRTHLIYMWIALKKIEKNPADFEMIAFYNGNPSLFN
jgi:hypothetical protein